MAMIIRPAGQLSPDEAEMEIFKLANENRKFGIAVDYPLSTALQDALERLMMAEWIRLIDVAMIAAGGQRLVRLFMVTKDGMDRIVELKGLVGGKQQ